MLRFPSFRICKSVPHKRFEGLIQISALGYFLVSELTKIA